jgi:hypothetical protein
MPNKGNKHSFVAASLRLTPRDHLARSCFRRGRCLLSASPIAQTMAHNCATPVKQTVQLT